MTDTPKFTPEPCKVYVTPDGFAEIIKADEPILSDGPHFLLARDVDRNYAPYFAAAPDLYRELFRALAVICSPQSFEIENVCADIQAVLHKAVQP